MKGPKTRRTTAERLAPRAKRVRLVADKDAVLGDVGKHDTLAGLGHAASPCRLDHDRLRAFGATDGEEHGGAMPLAAQDLAHEAAGAAVVEPQALRPEAEGARLAARREADARQRARHRVWREEV